jgi:transposase
LGVIFLPKGIPNQKYTGEFKQHVVETMHKEKLSCREATQQFGIGHHSHVSRWERIYFEEGPEGLYIERRGRAKKGRPAGLQKPIEEDLIAEVQRLRAENAYLKKLKALVLEEERLDKRRK